MPDETSNEPRVMPMGYFLLFPEKILMELAQKKQSAVITRHGRYIAAVHPLDNERVVADGIRQIMADDLKEES